SPRGAGATAARTPFVVLIVTLLAGGLISLLLLNSAVNQDSFQLNKLQKETTGYTDEQQELQQEVDGLSAPGALEERARQMGMVPGGAPAFLTPAGGVHGTPQAATAPPPSPTPTPTLGSASPAVSAGSSATPSGQPQAGSPASGAPGTTAGTSTPSPGTSDPTSGR
ncbi:FtsB/FtsL family cell division protein, partial [Actinacidiphila rubida]